MAAKGLPSFPETRPRGWHCDALLLVSQAREHRGHRDNIPEGTAPGSDYALGPTDFLHGASRPCIPSIGWQNPTPHTLSSVKTLWVTLTTRLSSSFTVTAGNSQVSLMTSLMAQSEKREFGTNTGFRDRQEHDIWARYRMSLSLSFPFYLTGIIPFMRN